MKLKVRFVFIVFVLLLAVSCNMTGYHDLGEPVNRFGQFGKEASTYMRTQKNENGAVVELFTVSNVQEQYGSFSWLSVYEDSLAITVDLRAGTYERVKNKMTLSNSMHYINKYEEKSNPARVSGAVQDELSSEDQDLLTWYYNASAKIVQIDNNSYKRIDLIYDEIFTQTSPEWVDQFLKLYLLSCMSAHCRIEGFGGIGMLQYIGKTTIFHGLLFGSLEFSVDRFSNPISEFVYKNHCDVAGMILDGKMINKSDMNGNGKMEGVVSFEVQGALHMWHGYIDYSHIEISYTLPTVGKYLISMNDAIYEADYDYGNPGNFDLTDILDIDPENW